MKTGAELWPKARELLIPYEGMASQIYVLDLPIKDLGSTLDKLSDSVDHPRVITLDGQAGNLNPLTSELREELIRRSKNSTYHVLQGNWAPGTELSLWLWIDATSTAFDAELVFWSDLLFPDPEDDMACIEAFSKLVELAEAFRDINPGSECVLSASETGDPRDHRNKPWTLFW